MAKTDWYAEDAAAYMEHASETWDCAVGWRAKRAIAHALVADIASLVVDGAVSTYGLTAWLRARDRDLNGASSLNTLIKISQAMTKGLENAR